MQGKMSRNLILDICNTGRQGGTAFSLKFEGQITSS